MTAAPLAVSDEQRASLERMARSTSLPHRTVVQAKALLLAADGMANNEVARRCETTNNIVPAVLAAEEPAVDGGTILQVLRGGADVLTVAALLLGILAVAGEHRHGTIVPSLLVSPRRGRFLAAKLGSQGALAVVLALAMSAVGLITGTAYLATRDVSVDLLSSDVVLTVLAMTLVVTLYAVIGAAVGALAKNQTAAVAGTLIWVFALENAIPLVLGDPGLKRWLPGGLSDRLLQVAEPVGAIGSAWLALVMFAGVAAVLAGAALVAAKTADVH